MKFFPKNLFSVQPDLGVSFHRDGIALASLGKGKNSRPLLKQTLFIPCSESSADARLLKDALRRLGLTHRSCVAVLDMEDYQLLQVEPPEVPEHEMHSALRWQVRDLLSYPVEEAVLDYFAVPRQGSRNPVSYVVVAHRDVLARRINLLHDAKIKISALDVPEMVLRNIGALMTESRQGAALLYLGEKNGLILLIRDGLIHLARKLGFGLNGFSAVSTAGRGGDFGGQHESAGAMEEVFERLVLEVQRSLDYFESSFRLPPVASLAIAPLQGDGDDAALFATLQSGLAIPCRWLDPRELFSAEEPPVSPDVKRCVAAVGAALRGMEGAS